MDFNSILLGLVSFGFGVAYRPIRKRLKARRDRLQDKPVTQFKPTIEGLTIPLRKKK